MHASWPTKQRLAIFKFCPVSNISKKTGRISIWAGLKPFLYTFYITLVMSKNWYRRFSRLVTQFSRLLQQKLSYVRYYLTIGRLFHHAFLLFLAAW